MTLACTEIAIALLLAVGFGCLGEIILWRRSEDLFSWNESFLVGAGTSAALLFPLSMLWKGHALRATLALLGIGILLAAVQRFRDRPDAPSVARSESGASRDPVAIALQVSIALVALAFAVLNFRQGLLWDGFQIWASKAQILYHRGSLGGEWYPGASGNLRVLNYPALVPLYEALMGVVRGGFDFDALKPVFLVFYLSMLLFTFAGTRAISSERMALAATLLLALLPAVSTGFAAGGYADMPQATFVAGVAASSLRRCAGGRGWRCPLPWLIGSLAMVKSEGVPLALIACLAIVLFWWLDKPRSFLDRCRREAAGAAVVAVFLALRLGYLRWLNIADPTYGPFDALHVSRARTPFGADARLCLQELLDLHQWGLFWPAFVLALAALLARGAAREKCLALATVTGVGAYGVVFLFSYWPLESRRRTRGFSRSSLLRLR